MIAWIQTQKILKYLSPRFAEQIYLISNIDIGLIHLISHSS